MAITNTSKIRPDLLLLLAMDAQMKGGNPTDFIEQMEAEGTREAAKSMMLPYPRGEGTRLSYEALGFVFGPQVEGDPLFCHATFPEGWSVQTTEHDMYNDLVDAKGRVRGNYFYKAAFYDRKAELRGLVRRYEIRQDWDVKRPAFRFYVIDNATNETLFHCSGVEQPELSYSAREAAEELVRDQAKDWLEANSPDYMNPLAYWD